MQASAAGRAGTRRVGTGVRMSLLSVRGLTVRFGGLTALADLDLEIARGSVHAVIGPNGAGKTTLFNVLTGVVRPAAGSVWFVGRRIDRLPPDEIARLGVARTFQNVRLFWGLSVEENVLIGTHRLGRAGLLAAIVRPRWVVEEERRLGERARELLALVGLEHYREVTAGQLPYGAQRRLEIARALASDPQILLLDEPTAGMTASEADELAATIRQVNAQGVTILLIAHDMRFVHALAHRITALHYGRKISEGRPEDVVRDPEVLRAYLGGSGLSDAAP